MQGLVMGKKGKTRKIYNCMANLTAWSYEVTSWTNLLRLTYNIKWHETQ